VALVMVQRLGEHDLAQIVSKWPDGKVVEVRRCRRCAGLISVWRDEAPFPSPLAEAS
jgi:hypothetical protein